MAVIGIDLGTTNSLAAVWRNGKPEIVHNALGEALTPSVVGVNDDGEIITGRLAKERLQTHPHQTIATFKRYMGSDKQFTLGKHQFRAEDLSAFILRALKADTEAFLGEPVTEAIISVPAYFNDAQRKATRAAGTLAGMKVERVINEPTAAAIAYGLHRRDEESTFLVFDLGGGTFDVSILELFSGVMEVHASAGDNFLGGEDFVDVLVDRFVAANRLDLNQLNARDQARIRQEAERCKRMLTQHERITMSVTLGDQAYSLALSQDDFEQWCSALLERVRAPLLRAMNDAKLKASQLDDIILVGGASRMPLIRRLVARLFGRLPAAHLDPDQVVAVGAAVQVGLKLQDQALDDVVLTDVAPYTLGIDISREVGSKRLNGLFHPIIERNTVVPISKVDSFVTVHHQQSAITFGIFQGESRHVKDNIKLGEITVNVPPRAAGQEAADVRFTYDINGLLEVDVTVRSTGKCHNLLIEGNPGVLTAEEIEKRREFLATLKVHPRENTENSTLLARGARLYEESKGELRAYLGEILAQFEVVLDQQDGTQIEQVRSRLTEILNEIESRLL